MSAAATPKIRYPTRLVLLGSRAMRMSLFTLALLIAACAPAPTEPAQDTAATSSETPIANADAAALGAAPQPGAWSFRTDEGTSAAGFGPPESEYLLTIVCTGPSGAITIRSSHELAPDQRTTLRLITSTQSLDLPADSFNEGLPSVDAQIGDSDPLKPLLIGMLGAPTERFAVEVAGEANVFPWDESIARALIACR
jgi:hypothetical protein